MSITTFSPAVPRNLPHLCSHASFRTLPFPSSPPPMNLLRLKPHPSIFHLLRHRRRPLSLSAAAVRQDTTTYTSAPLVDVSPAAESLFHVTVDVADSPDLAASYTIAGQYLQLRVPDSDKPSFLAIASPPSLAATKGVFEFLVKTVPGSTAELLCGLQKGDVVELTQAMGKGFQIDQISPPENYQSVLIFATGAGISPIRSLIESGFGADKRSDVRLYYGARNLTRMAYQDRFKEWASSGVEIVPVLSQPDQNWTGEQGYVQAAFARAKRILSPQSTGAVLCGQKAMAEDVTSLLVSEGVSTEKILKNF
ncbi:OLC1v1032159C5 [Oldenlandia corymbosa var. corymbosa]|uniref:OLC1v1032159C5 n=1 Tax=Oldenlandia corymbosa var. corymbosa TaxID=529605 RepID=A0AAV1CKK2_OLDCO|nr:OLC1v1032159C5 [Oldenlandia corymbosa var. corymbosa]